MGCKCTFDGSQAPQSPYFGTYQPVRGFVTSFGAFQTFYETGLLQHESASSISWIGSTQSCLLFVIGTLSGPLFDAGHLRTLLFVGTFLNVLGIMMTSICNSFWQVFLAQGIVIGLGDGLLFPASLAIIAEYFTTRRSLATGISTAGSSIAAVVYPVLFSQLQPRIGFGWTMRVIGWIALATSLIYLGIMRRKFKRSEQRRLIDFTAFKSISYVLYCWGAFFGFMAVYIAYFYVELYAIEETNTTHNLATNLLAILNGSSILGRVLPSLLADHIGPLNVIIPSTTIAGILLLCWIRIRATADLVAFCVLYGIFTGTFVSLHGPIVVVLSDDLDTVGTRIGMALGISGFGILVGNPVAGAILRSNGGWLGLQVWCGILMLVSPAFMVASRISKFGWEVCVKA